MKQNPEVAFGLFVAGVNALFVAALFTWADIRPESDWWALSPPKVALVFAAPNFAPAILLWRTRRDYPSLRKVDCLAGSANSIRSGTLWTWSVSNTYVDVCTLVSKALRQLQTLKVASNGRQRTPDKTHVA